MARKLSRRAVTRYIAQQLADGASSKQLTLQLAAYLIESHRINELSIIVRDITTQLAELGHVTGTITTARELSSETHKAVEAYAKKKTNATYVKLDTLVDESVLGGVKLELPGYELDTTIGKRLTTLTTRYKKA